MSNTTGTRGLESTQHNTADKDITITINNLWHPSFHSLATHSRNVFLIGRRCVSDSQQTSDAN